MSFRLKLRLGNLKFVDIGTWDPIELVPNLAMVTLTGDQPPNVEAVMEYAKVMPEALWLAADMLQSGPLVKRDLLAYTLQDTTPQKMADKLKGLWDTVLGRPGALTPDDQRDDGYLQLLEHKNGKYHWHLQIEDQKMDMLYGALLYAGFAAKAGFYKVTIRPGENDSKPAPDFMPGAKYDGVPFSVIQAEVEQTVPSILGEDTDPALRLEWEKWTNTRTLDKPDPAFVPMNNDLDLV